jgi:hypothetical protein
MAAFDFKTILKAEIMLMIRQPKISKARYKELTDEKTPVGKQVMKGLQLYADEVADEWEKSIALGKQLIEDIAAVIPAITAAFSSPFSFPAAAAQLLAFLRLKFHRAIQLDQNIPHNLSTLCFY